MIIIIVIIIEIMIRMIKIMVYNDGIKYAIIHFCGINERNLRI